MFQVLRLAQCVIPRSELYHITRSASKGVNTLNTVLHEVKISMSTSSSAVRFYVGVISLAFLFLGAGSDLEYNGGADVRLASTPTLGQSSTVYIHLNIELAVDENTEAIALWVIRLVPGARWVYGEARQDPSLYSIYMEKHIHLTRDVYYSAGTSANVATCDVRILRHVVSISSLHEQHLGGWISNSAEIQYDPKESNVNIALFYGANLMTPEVTDHTRYQVSLAELFLLLIML